MKISLESTTRLVDINGVPARIWEGMTDGGVRCYAAITRIAAHNDDDNSEFERDLREHAPPSSAAEIVFPLKMIL